VRQGDQGGGPHPCPQIEQRGRGRGDRRPEQHGVEAGAEAVAGLRHLQAAAEKGIARRRLLFYKIGIVV
jgi:hypothetical protein